MTGLVVDSLDGDTLVREGCEPFGIATIGLGFECKVLRFFAMLWEETRGEDVPMAVDDCSLPFYAKSSKCDVKPP